MPHYKRDYKRLKKLEFPWLWRHAASHERDLADKGDIMTDLAFTHGIMECLIWSIGILEYWNDGFMDRYYPERGWRSVRLRRT
jgi:hypothetical protein